MYQVKIFNNKLKYDDIEIYGNTPDKIKFKLGYNIGDLLNMPHLRADSNNLENIWKYSWTGPNTKKEDLNIVSNILVNPPILDLTYEIGNIYKDSIISNYIKNRDINEPVPNIKRIIDSVNLFNECNSHKYKELYNDVQKNDTLCVHVRLSDLHAETSYINLIHNYGNKFKKVYLFTGIHLDERYKKNNDKIINTINTINKIIKNKHTYYVVLASPDVHISLMSKAKNLLLHKGGFSMLGAIVCRGNIFIDKKIGNLFFSKIFNLKSKNLTN